MSLGTYVVPAGQFQGRQLCSLTPAELSSLRRTRMTALAEARQRAAEMMAAPRTAAQPSANIAAPAEPEPCLPLVLYTRNGQPRQPIAPTTSTPWPQIGRFWKLVVLALVLVLVHPPLAELPGFCFGYGLRAVGQRFGLAANHFWSSFAGQLNGLATDALEWVENTMWPLPPPEGAVHPPGQRLALITAVLAAFRWVRLG